jgi:hypothetical protein
MNARLATLLCSALLVSCGGSITSAGIGGTGISYGAVTGFGSIIVNDSHLDVSTATVTLDGNPGNASDPNGGLKIGMVVKVSGSFDGNTGTAASVEYRDNLEGPVCDAPPTIDGIRILRVLGQTVILDATTIVDSPDTIDTISLGNIVEVSGLPDKDGAIHASFIEVKDLIDAVIEVKGRVSNVIGSAFTINALDVDFSSIGIINGVPANGQFVEVKGAFICGVTTDMLMASSVGLEPEGAGSIPDGVNAEIEGFITTPLNANSFMIGNRQVVITGSTRFLPEGFDDLDIVVGAKIEAEGTSASGVLTATKISFRENVRLESDVANGDNSSFKLDGFPNIDITTNSATDDNGITVSSGLHIRVRGIEGPNNTVLAIRIRIQSGTDIFLQGAVDDISGADVTILGVTVDTSSIFQFEDVDDLPISSATFLGLVQPGTLVKFKGDLLSGVPPIIWDEAELEDD